MIKKSILLLSLAVLICCVLYPLALWIIGQLLFPFQAQGSFLKGADGKRIGSRLIAQPFTQELYFTPRPSAASYNAAASSSSSLAASNPQLQDRVVQLLKNQAGVVPGDFVTTSASGLDPHITLQNALYQLDRVSSAWANRIQEDPKKVREEIERLLHNASSAPLWGLAGEKIVNVLEINIALQKKFNAPTK